MMKASLVQYSGFQACLVSMFSSSPNASIQVATVCGRESCEYKSIIYRGKRTNYFFHGRGTGPIVAIRDVGYLTQPRVHLFLRRISSSILTHNCVPTYQRSLVESIEALPSRLRPVGVEISSSSPSRRASFSTPPQQGSQWVGPLSGQARFYLTCYLT
jgi:hypothetical protein